MAAPRFWVFAAAVAVAAVLALQRRGRSGGEEEEEGGGQAGGFKPGSLIAGRRRCLVLGDGNLSFALAVVRLLQSRESSAGPWQYFFPRGLFPRMFFGSSSPESLLITTYDTVAQLREKYGADEMERVLYELSKAGDSLTLTRVSTDHGVDATKLTEYFNGKDATNVRQFDIIVWNFPHWGGRGAAASCKSDVTRCVTLGSRHMGCCH